MGRLAFVFSGQGDQYPGMGKDLFDRYPAAVKAFDLVDELRPGTSSQCFYGSAEELRQTAICQPCLYAFELAAAWTLREAGIIPDAVAGFSLGEMTAATVAGCFSPVTGFRLVCRRGALMQEAAEQSPASMAAVLRLPADEVERLCQEFDKVYAVNFNCPGQTTVAGSADELPAFNARVKAAGGRAVPLAVSGGFHSPFMASASQAFARDLAQAEVHAPALPLYSNVTAAPYAEAADTLLARQIISPVRWEALVSRMICNSIDTFVEIGPGQTLTHMINRIDPAVRAVPLKDYLEELPC